MVEPEQSTPGVKGVGDSFTVAFSGVPRRACVPFLSAIAGDADVQDVRVDGTSAKWNTGGQLDVPTLAAACQESGNVLEVVYYSGLASGGSVATVIELAAPVPSPFLDAPTTPAGPVASAPSVDDALPGNPVTPSPGGLPSAPPAVPALPPAAATPLVPQPSPIGQRWVRHPARPAGVQRAQRGPDRRFQLVSAVLQPRAGGLPGADADVSGT
ncbi:hypothetical protein GIW57_18400 [Stenotrophomonas sp. PA-6-5C]|nr:hypothetical protein [Stenotrophomonas sp. PA-6-5C]